MDDRRIFHVHTFRCKHAEMISDEEYVRQAFNLGATEITFTDHAPFPNDPFGNRMDMEQLPEYMSTLSDLKRKYAGRIDVRIGLEVEYLPSFRNYYEYLKGLPEMDLLILGQHFYKAQDGQWSFQLSDKTEEWKYCLEAQQEGSQTGLFSVIAHPDRLFRRSKQWTDEMQDQTSGFIKELDSAVSLEINIASKRRKQIREEFWNLAPDSQKRIIGIDAHSIRELQKGFLLSAKLAERYGLSCAEK